MTSDLDRVRPLDTVQIQARGVIRLLSKQVSKAVNLREGDFLRVSVDDEGRIILEPCDLIPRSERYLHTASWKQRLEEAEQDRSAGRVRRVENTEDLLAEIDRAVDELED